VFHDATMIQPEYIYYRSASILGRLGQVHMQHHKIPFRDRAYDLTVALRELCKDSGNAFHKRLAAVRYIGIVLDVEVADIAISWPRSC
jgi:hypothetical protein